MIQATATRATALITAVALTLSGCASGTTRSVTSGNPAKPIAGSPVTANPTPYSTGLVCLANYARSNNLAAPRIADYTGKEEGDGSGRKVTQGASLMAMSALAKAGMPLVERFDTSVSELELKYTNNRLISDAPNPQPDAPAEYRRIYSGQVPGSDFYLAGGITELNYNIRSSGGDAYIADRSPDDPKGTFRSRDFVMNIGMDLRLINTRTLEVVDVISYQKQVVGHEIGLGVFNFLNGNIFDISAGGGALEPIQLAVRSMIERAVIEMSANLYGMPGPQSCLSADPLGAGVRTTGLTGGFVPAYDNLETNNAQTREESGRWTAYGATDRGGILRGRY